MIAKQKLSQENINSSDLSHVELAERKSELPKQ